jgi:hypothetical protein
MLLATAARRHTADHLSAVSDALLGMESPLLTRETLADHAGASIDENAHVNPCKRGAQGTASEK